MTETQATPGATSTSPADSDGAESPDSAAESRTVVGRASVSGDGAAPKFTRAPGMPPPPDVPESAPSSAPSANASGRASVPAGARMTATAAGRAPAESPTGPVPGTGARPESRPAGSSSRRLA